MNEEQRLKAVKAFREYRYEKLINGEVKYMSLEYSVNKGEWEFVFMLQKAYRYKFNRYITYNEIGKAWFNDPMYFRRLHTFNRKQFQADHITMMKNIIDGKLRPHNTMLDWTLSGMSREYVLKVLDKCEPANEGEFSYFVTKDDPPEAKILNLVRYAFSYLRSGEFISFSDLVTNELRRPRSYLTIWNHEGFSARDLDMILRELRNRGLRLLNERLYQSVALTINKYNSMFKEYYIKYEKRLIQHYLSERSKISKKNEYPPLFLRSDVSKMQSEILIKFQGGRDMLTGEKFIDIYKRENPDGLSQSELNSMSAEELMQKLLRRVERHHYKTYS